MSQLNSGQLKNTQTDSIEHDVYVEAKRVAQVPSLYGFRVVGSATSGSPLYVGECTVPGASESSSAWVITRIIYTSGSGLVEGKVATGAWNDRASLTYV